MNTPAAPLRVAIIGSGPAGIYAADALTKQDAIPVAVDVFDRLPTPYGLVRYGVAPDHKSIKSIARVLRDVLERPGVRFLGGVEFGKDITREDLHAAYDATIYSTGAMVDRRLGIPGEDLPGSVAATDFVNWYCGHPDVDVERFVLDAREAVVIGVGNVAVDVVRILAKTAEELSDTDVPEPMLSVLAESRIERVHMVGRRGPEHAKFTPKELRELGQLPSAGVHVQAAEMDFDLTSEELLKVERAARNNLKVLTEWASREPAELARRIDVRFWLRPVEILGTDHVEGIKLERTRLDEDGRVTGTGEYETLPAQLVLRSVGYQSVPLPDVPFDDRAKVVPNDEGRVLGPEGSPMPGDYVAGWIKRGPTGVIGTNKSDAAQTVRSLLADMPEPGPDPRAPIEELLAERGVKLVTYEDWLKIDRAEIDLGTETGRGERVKLVGWQGLYTALHR